MTIINSVLHHRTMRLASLLLVFLLLPAFATLVSAQNWWVDSFDLVSVDRIDEFSPDGDPWEEGERIPVTYTVRSEADNSEYLYTFAESSSIYWIDVEPWARIIAAGATVTINSHIIAPDNSGRHLVKICIMDGNTDAGYARCEVSGYAEFKGASFSWLCCFGFGIIAVIAMAFIDFQAKFWSEVPVALGQKIGDSLR